MAQSSTNVIMFISVLIAGIILTSWYISAIHPTRLAIGTVQEDVREIAQHLTNACSVTIYNATYGLASQGFIEVNSTHLCIYNPAYGECKLLPCTVEPNRMTIAPGMILSIQKSRTITLGRISGS